VMPASEVKDENRNKKEVLLLRPIRPA